MKTRDDRLRLIYNICRTSCFALLAAAVSVSAQKGLETEPLRACSQGAVNANIRAITIGMDRRALLALYPRTLWPETLDRMDGVHSVFVNVHAEPKLGDLYRVQVKIWKGRVYKLVADYDLTGKGWDTWDFTRVLEANWTPSERFVAGSDPRGYVLACKEREIVADAIGGSFGRIEMTDLSAQAEVDASEKARVESDRKRFKP